MTPTLRGKAGAIPSFTIFGSKFKKARAAAEKVDAVVRKSRDLGQRYQEKEREIASLERQYDAALTDAALERGGADPDKLAGQIGEAQLEKERLSRKVQASRRAVDIATSELAQLVQGEQPELLAEVNARIVKAADLMLETTLELQKQENELSELEHLKLWVTEPERNLHSGPADVGRNQQIDAILASAMAVKGKASEAGEADVGISNASVS